MAQERSGEDSQEAGSLLAAAQLALEAAYRRGYYEGYFAATVDHSGANTNFVEKFYQGPLSRWRFKKIKRVEPPPRLE